MSDMEYPNTGALFKTKEKKHEKAPDMWGEVKLDRDLVRQLLDDTNGLVTIKLDGWKNVSAAGNSYLSLKVNTWKPEGQSAPKPAATEKDPWDD